MTSGMKIKDSFKRVLMRKEDIKHLADLSKLEFGEQELADFGKEFAGILNFVSQVDRADIAGEMILPTISFASLREDIVRKSLGKQEILNNAPESNGDYFIVPQVVE